MSSFLKGLGSLFSLKKPVAEGRIGDAEDVLNTKKALSLTGDYQSPVGDDMTWLPDNQLYDGIKSFQKKNNLKVDGVMNPGGPTARKLDNTLAQKAQPRSLETADEPEGWGEKFARQVQHNKAIHQSGFNVTGSVNGKAVSQTNPSAAKTPEASPRKPDPKAQQQARQLLQQAAQTVQKTRQPVVPSGEGVDERIRSIMNDPRYIRGDKDIMQHVRDQFTRAYPGKTRYDATGKMIWPTPVIGPEEVEAFDPDGVLQQPGQEDGQRAGWTELASGMTGQDSLPGGSDKDRLRGNELLTGLRASIPATSQASSSSSFDTYLENLGPREGGVSNHPDDPGGLTKKGVSQETLTDLRKLPMWKNLPERADQLSDGQIRSIYFEEYYRRPKVDKLEQVPGLKEASPKLAEQLFDSFVLHGADTPGIWLQQAILEETGIDVREIDHKTGRKFFDGNIGPKTRKALAEAVKAGKAKTINNLIAQKRLEYMRDLDWYVSFEGGWETRAKSFIQE